MNDKNLSSEGIKNLNNLLFLLKNRLHSSSKSKSVDKENNIIYIDSDIYSKEMLESFITLSISEFNQTPNFTFFTMENSRFIDCFTEILIEGATLYALSSKALIERGREFSYDDGKGISIIPPSVSEMLNTQFSTMLVHHWNKLKFIKSSIRDFS